MVNILAVYGGTRIETQIRALKKGPQIIVGTPGRTKDLIRRKKLFVDNIERGEPPENPDKMIKVQVAADAD